MDHELIERLWREACDKTGGYGDIETARCFAALVAEECAMVIHDSDDYLADRIRDAFKANP